MKLDSSMPSKVFLQIGKYCIILSKPLEKNIEVKGKHLLKDEDLGTSIILISNVESNEPLGYGVLIPKVEGANMRFYNNTVLIFRDEEVPEYAQLQKPLTTYQDIVCFQNPGKLILLALSTIDSKLEDFLVML